MILGCPQGGLLAGVLFALLLNDFLLENWKMELYVDNMKLIVNISNLNDIKIYKIT